MVSRPGFRRRNCRQFHFTPFMCLLDYQTVFSCLKTKKNQNTPSIEVQCMCVLRSFLG